MNVGTLFTSICQPLSRLMGVIALLVTLWASQVLAQDNSAPPMDLSGETGEESAAAPLGGVEPQLLETYGAQAILGLSEEMLEQVRGGDTVTPTLAIPLPSPGIIGDGGLQAIAEAVRTRYDMPAMAVVLVRQGSISEMASTGVRIQGGTEAVTDNDRWHLGSITKSMTSTLVAVLVEQGVIAWDTTPADSFPQFVGEMHPSFKIVTLAQLLSHQAGLTVDIAGIPSINSVTDAATGTVPEKRLLWARELLTTTPVTTRGTFLYTNADYIVAGAMIEAATGTAWEDLMVQQVFGPLGMNRTGFGAPGNAALRDQPWGHKVEGGGLAPVSPDEPDADNPKSLGPAGTAHTTLADIALYMLAHIEGERGVPGIVTAPGFQFLHAPFNGTDYGMGWEIISHDPSLGVVLNHDGSNGRWFAGVGLFPALDIGAFAVTNAGGVQAETALQELGDLIVQRIAASQ